MVLVSNTNYIITQAGLFTKGALLYFSLHQKQQ